MPDEYVSPNLGRRRSATQTPPASSSSEKSTPSSTTQHEGSSRQLSETTPPGRHFFFRSPMASQSVFRTRPEAINSKEGKSGRVVQLSANYLKVNRKPDFAFTLYRVDFEPEIEIAGLRNAFVRAQQAVFGGHIFDGHNMIYMTRHLPQDPMTFTMTSREGENYKMIVKNTGTKIESTDGMAMQILNIALRRTMEELKLQLVGRNLYDPVAKVILKDLRIELWPGYVTSIRQHEMDILLCVELSHKVMRQETIYELLRACRNESIGNWREDFKKEIIGSIVLTDYNNKTYRVDDVSFGESPLSTFQQKGKTINFVEYYKQRYNLVINDHNQPLLISNPKPSDIRAGRTDPIALVPELCRATGLTDKMRSNFTMMRSMSEHTRIDPEQRRNRLTTLRRRISNTPASQQRLESFNMDIENQLVSFQGRALKQETMVYGGGRTSQNDDRVDWTNAVKTQPMYEMIPLKRWALVYPKRAVREVKEFLDHMMQVSRGMNYDVSPPKEFEMPDDRTATYVSHIQEIISKDPRMIMIVVPNNAADRYAAIKKMTCVDRTIPTQIIIQKTLMPKKGNISGVKSIATKVMVQINCKLGGAPWMINFPLKGTMTIGFDVNHDTRDKSKSFGAFVATMDLKETVKFFSSALPHRDGTEISNNIEIQAIQALKQFKNTHGALPERIFFYRDGVGDGQIEFVQKMEVQRLQKKFAELYTKFGDGIPPKFSFIIVSKRLNTRIFANKGNKFENPVSGTVVDNTITLPERYDFFLVSQSVRQGTVAPTSYNVIHDTNGLDPDKMQMLSYKHTHLYYNWSGCTRVPAVVQYAHKLALLAGQSLHQSPNQSWDNQLYFL